MCRLYHCFLCKCYHYRRNPLRNLGRFRRVPPVRLCMSNRPAHRYYTSYCREEQHTRYCRSSLMHIERDHCRVDHPAIDSSWRHNSCSGNPQKSCTCHHWCPPTCMRLPCTLHPVDISGVPFHQGRFRMYPVGLEDRTLGRPRRTNYYSKPHWHTLCLHTPQSTHTAAPAPEHSPH